MGYKIAWFCIPAHGHTNPTLGIVKEMVAAGTKELGAGEMLLSGEKSEIVTVLDKVLNHLQYKEAAIRISKSFKESGGAVRAKEFLESLDAGIKM